MISTCVACGNLQDFQSEEEANSPYRMCRPCFVGKRKKDPTPMMTDRKLCQSLALIGVVSQDYLRSGSKFPFEIVQNEIRSLMPELRRRFPQ